MSTAKMKSVEVYMCKVDWDHEIGHAACGNTVYASIEDIKQQRMCVVECGIVKVKVELIEVVLSSSRW